MAVKAYLEAIMTIEPENRAAAAEVYTTYRQPFLDDIEGALTKELLVRDEDVQVIHGFDSMEPMRRHTSRATCSRARSPRPAAALGSRSRYPLLRSCIEKARLEKSGRFFDWTNSSGGASR